MPPAEINDSNPNDNVEIDLEQISSAEINNSIPNDNVAIDLEQIPSPNTPIENPDESTLIEEEEPSVVLEPFDDLSSLVGENQVVEIANNLGFTEGPLWVPGQDYLLFSDLPRELIWKWSEVEGLTIFRNQSERANGLAIDPLTNDLIACEHLSRSISRSPLNGDKSIVVSEFNGNALNSPNDCIVDTNGQIYFTDPPYGLAGRPAELDFNGLFLLDSQGILQRLAIETEFNRPNGLAFNRDKSKLYVADTADNQILVFDLLANGLVENGKIFASVTSPDGIKVDQRDHLYVASRGGIAVYKPDATLIGTIMLPFQPSNCAFGGHEMDTLYITARSSVFRLKLNTVGIR